MTDLHSDDWCSCSEERLLNNRTADLVWMSTEEKHQNYIQLFFCALKTYKQTNKMWESQRKTKTYIGSAPKRPQADYHQSLEIRMIHETFLSECSCLDGFTEIWGSDGGWSIRDVLLLHWSEQLIAPFCWVIISIDRHWSTADSLVNLWSVFFLDFPSSAVLCGSVEGSSALVLK